MKKFAITFIRIYQTVVSTSLKNIFGISSMCRFEVTCSEYSKQQILKNGIIKGSYESLVRIIKCNPFYPAPFNNRYFQTQRYSGFKMDNMERTNPFKKGSGVYPPQKSINLKGPVK